MKKNLVCALLAFGGIASAQASTNLASTDPLDISRFKDVASGTSLPTPNTVAALKVTVDTLVSAGKCQDALPVLETLATQSNWLANLITAGLEPYYNASSKARSSFKSLDDLVPYETQANQYIEQRNLATVIRAECLVKLNKKNEAAAVYARVLDLIDIEDWAIWNRAVKGLYALINVTPPSF